MTTRYYGNDDDEVPMDDEDSQYADEDENEERNVRHLHGQMFDDDDDDDDDDGEPNQNEEQTMKSNNRQRDDRNPSRESDADEMNLIDYVIEEEKEIGGAKGEDSHSLSGSTTYSSLMSNDEDQDQTEMGNQERKEKKVKLTAKDEGQVIRARAFLNRLDKKVDEKDEHVKQVRESIYYTKEKITKLEHQKARLESDIDCAKDQRNVTTVNRLTNELTRVVRELSLERDVLIDFQTKLDAAEMARTKAIIERARYNQEEAVLKEKENQSKEDKQSMTQLRQRQEDWKVTQMKRAHLSALRTQKQALEQQAAAQRTAMEEARRSKKLAQKYLQQTIAKVRDEKRMEEDVSRAETEKKIKSLLNLRNAIERNKDTLAIQTAQKKAHERETREKKQQEQQSMENAGQNGLFYMLRKEKNEKLEQMQKRFAEQQELNRVAIVEKILKEENEMDRKRKLYPELYKSASKAMSTTSLSTTTKEDDVSQPSQDQSESVIEVPQPAPTSQLDVGPVDYASSMTSVFQNEEFDEDMDVDLARPEFDGRWDKQAVKQEVDPLFNRSKHWKTKMDKEILQRTLTRLKDNIVREQVVGTKKFEGPVPFKSDPTEIVFKDFDVNKIYRTKVTLTNVTLTINTLKLVDLTEGLKDFVTLKFEPPGMISAGMSCYLYVTFEPKINENLSGEIKFLAQTGMFTIPIRCEIKKVELSLDKNSVQLGSTVVDERLFQSVTLKNTGALGTTYRLVKTSVLRAEKTKEATSETPKKEIEDKEKVKESNEGSTPCASSLDRPSPSESDLTELVEKEYTEVFLIKGEERGFLVPHSSVTFAIEFSAPVAGTFQEEYTLVFDSKIPNLHFTLYAQSLDVPVWIENPSIDFKICMFDRLYQDALVLRNRSSAALRVSVDILPRSLQQHIEIVPRTAYIQAKSSFSLQVKLTARPSIVEDDLSTELFDPKLNTLIVPLEVKVADQIRTVPFSISAILTSSDLQFDVEQIDFGCCTTSESVTTKIQLKNHSLLAQPFGFINVPDYIQVQPNDGFGTLLPEETIDLHVLFSPSATKEYRCTLVCKSLVNREFTIECQGVGVLPPLSLSSTVIHLPATPINDQSIAVFYVENRHLDKNHFKHPVPRIGNGEFAPVGPTSFQFDLPPNAPITLSPLVGIVEPGTRQKITVRLAPKLENERIRAESVRLKETETRKQSETKDKDSSHKTDSKAKQVGISVGGGATRRSDAHGSGSSDADLTPAGEQTNEWSLAQSSLLRSYASSLSSFLVPCYVAPGTCDKPGQLTYDVANTLFIQIHCPVVRPEMIVVSDFGRTMIDFGSASIGQELSRSVLVQNISSKPIQLYSTLLNVNGPFRVINALRRLESGETTSIKVAFKPNEIVEYLETLELTSESSKLTLCLKGFGLKPNVQLSFDTTNPFNMGCVLAKERVEKTFQIVNHSDTAVTFRVDLASQHLKNRTEQNNKNVWNAAVNHQQHHLIGPQNLSGRSVFDIAPLDGVIPAGSKKPLTVTFSPDHDSDYFSDLVRITISEQPAKLEFRLRGSGRQNTMYIRPLDNTSIIQKSLLPNISDSFTAQLQSADPTEKGVPGNILVLLCAQYQNGKYIAAQRELTIGCAVVGAGSKKNGDYTFDNTKEINAEGFNLDVPKSSVEIGTEKTVKITWTPAANFDPGETARAMINVTTKGDVVRTWRLILVGYVEIISSFDKQASRISKTHRPTLTNDTRSRASFAVTNQAGSKQASIQETKYTPLT